MRATEAYAKFLQFGRPVLTTREASALLKVGTFATIGLLGQLARHGLMTRLRRGMWGIAGRLTPYSLPEYLTAPYPSYVSLWTALHVHGMITQIPRIIYLVSLGRPRRIRTESGTYEVHRIMPDLFGGFRPHNGGKIGTPEKALFDTVYILGFRGKRSVRLPELELPDNFNEMELKKWIERIPSKRLKTLTAFQLERCLATARANGAGLRTEKSD